MLVAAFVTGGFTTESAMRSGGEGEFKFAGSVRLPRDRLGSEAGIRGIGVSRVPVNHVPG